LARRCTGWAEDQRWTLAGVTTLIGRLFHVGYPLRGTFYLLHRIGFSPQVHAHRAAEREGAIAALRAVTWGKVRGLAAATGAWVFEDEAGQNLRPPKTRIWAPAAGTPWSPYPARNRCGYQWRAWSASWHSRTAPPAMVEATLFRQRAPR